MSSSDGAHWDPQSQRWEWGPAPARGPEQPATPPPASAQPPTVPSPLPAAPPPTAPGYHEPWPPMPSAPAYVPPPPPPPGGGGQWRTPVLVGLAAAVVGGAAVAAWMLLGAEDGAGGDARPPASPSGQQTTPEPGPSSPGPTSPSPTTPSPSPSTGGGHTVVHNENGFSVAVPNGWEPSTDETGSGSFYRRPGDRSALLQIFRITESSSMGSCTLLQISSDQLKANPGYRQVSIDPTAGSGCELVYEYDSSESNGRRRGMERIVTTPGGGRWALLAAGPAADATTTRANLTAALESFRPD
ncbi:hypothetical protein [Streptomyces lavendulae]|uniref:hypothetical protein n=1 Tax=Streptomyces lavendulae TaxID=1914 RepID=UPI0024A5F792|nr:hypothetical protein [Streptomyces lavendulae]GLX18036.1 hypothetical protein Slala01_16800 [Streptomyces lavendulae subsp. lavendulae]GLX26380.1 hypothetical protein Slala02_22000 [Streptomyces lavendulae subsp. lavendulae]